MKIKTLKNAAIEFDELQKNFKHTHSPQRFSEFNQAFATLFSNLKAYPMSGAVPVQAEGTGLNVRQLIAEQIRVIYSIEGQTIVVRMFLPTKMDFTTHLIHRLLHR